MFAISFMNEMRVASIEFAAYLQSSALAVSMNMIGAPVRVNGAYSSRMLRSARVSPGSTPTTTRSGFMKSSTAAPCLRNSGLLTTLNGCDVSVAMAACTSFAVPTGTVLLSTTTVYCVMARPTARATSSTCRRSAEPSSPCGVPTAMKTIADALTDDGRSVVNVNRSSIDVAPDHFFEAGLVDRHLPRAQRRDLRFVFVHAGNRVSVFGKAGAQHEPDVPCSHDGDFHFTIRY